MARSDHHGAYAFLIYYLIWILWKGTFIIGGEYRFIVFLIVIFGLFPDFDVIYYIIKKKGEGKIDTEFQHHLYYWTHWPLSYLPLIPLLIVSLIFNFYPEYFLVPIIGIYCGHLFFDSISCGDGVMWGKIPWQKGRYARYINLWKNGSDGYHGGYWEARYRKTIISKVGDIAVLSSIIIIFMFQIYTIIDYLNVADSYGISGYYLVPIGFFIVALILGKKTPHEKFLKEPPEGRYADYRTKPDYINGLSEKNRKKHLEKYSELLKQRGILEKINLK